MLSLKQNRLVAFAIPRCRGHFLPIVVFVGTTLQFAQLVKSGSSETWVIRTPKGKEHSTTQNIRQHRHRFVKSTWNSLHLVALTKTDKSATFRSEPSAEAPILGALARNRCVSRWYWRLHNYPTAPSHHGPHPCKSKRSARLYPVATKRPDNASATLKQVCFGVPAGHRSYAARPQENPKAALEDVALLQAVTPRARPSAANKTTNPSPLPPPTGRRMVVQHARTHARAAPTLQRLPPLVTPTLSSRLLVALARTLSAASRWACATGVGVVASAAGAAAALPDGTRRCVWAAAPAPRADLPAGAGCCCWA